MGSERTSGFGGSRHDDYLVAQGYVGWKSPQVVPPRGWFCFSPATCQQPSGRVHDMNEQVATGATVPLRKDTDMVDMHLDTKERALLLLLLDHKHHFLD
jgi:hypothetical protein